MRWRAEDGEKSCVFVCACVRVCLCVCGGGGVTFGVGESEERAVVAGEFEEHAENQAALEQLHRAACARAHVRVRVSGLAQTERGTVHAGTTAGLERCARCAYPAEGTLECSHWVSQVLTLGTLSTRRVRIPSSGYPEYSHRLP